MTTTDISHLNPALNPKQANGSMSAKYVTMDSQKLVESLLDLRSIGEPVFELRTIQFRTPRKSSSNMQYVGSHLIRIRTRQSFNVGKEDAVHPEILIKNSYDGHSQFEVRMGIFRLVCSNGLVIQTADFGEIKLRHMGTPAETAFDIAKQFAANLPKFQEVQNALIERKLTDEEMTSFAMKAAALRFKEAFNETDAEALLEVTRQQDEGNDMWRVFNRVQEKLMAGGFKAEGMKKKSKPIVRAQEDIRINKELFALAMSFINNDPEATPQPTEELVPEIVDEVADLEPVEVVADEIEVPVKPPKYLYEGESRRRVANPAYDRWMANFADLV